MPRHISIASSTTACEGGMEVQQHGIAHHPGVCSKYACQHGSHTTTQALNYQHHILYQLSSRMLQVTASQISIPQHLVATAMCVRKQCALATLQHTKVSETRPKVMHRPSRCTPGTGPNVQLCCQKLHSFHVRHIAAHRIFCSMQKASAQLLCWQLITTSESEPLQY